MKYKRYSVNVPVVLAEIIEERIKEIPYSSGSSYFLGLAIFDCWSRREHRFTAKLMGQPPKVRDEAFAKVAEQFRSGHKAESPWFDRMLQELVEAEIAKVDPVRRSPAMSRIKETSKPQRNGGR